MKRILWMILMNFWHVPKAAIQLLRMSSHPERYSAEEKYALIRRIADWGVRGGRVEIVSSGLDMLPKENGFIFYPNHQGLFDIMVLIDLIDRPVAPVLKKELIGVPFIRQIVACLGGLSLDRSDPRQGLKVILQMAQEVKEGRNFIIFAEGTRSRNGNHLLDFKGGSFKCATKSHCPIVPVALVDSYKVFDTGSMEKLTVQAHFLQPIYYEEYQDKKTSEIAAMVKERIEAKIEACSLPESESGSED